MAVAEQAGTSGGLVDRQYVVRRRVGNDVLERESGLDYGLVDLPYTAALEPGRNHLLGRVCRHPNREDFHSF